MKKLIFILSLTCFLSCTTHETNLEDITEEVISKQRGVVIDIEPGQKK